MKQHIFNPVLDTVTESLFGARKKGLFDSINKRNPEIWALYKKQKSLDWDEQEFDFSTCMLEFKTCPPDVRDIMIKTLAWQWEADSIAAHNLIPIVAPFVSSSELWAAWTKVNENEVLHALTYSEIVRSSFEHPDDVMESILAEVQSLQRLDSVMSVFAKVYQVSHRLALGQIDADSDETYDAIFMFVVANLILERVQFMASFAITFAIADSGWFMPIGQAVQKINVDELQIHVKLNKAVLTNELRLPEGQEAFIRNLNNIKAILEDVVDSEIAWNKHLFKDGNELAGIDERMIEKWILFNANDIYAFLRIDNPYEIINKNPLGFITEWININSVQVSPQESRGGNYLLGGIADTLGDRKIPIDFL